MAVETHKTDELHLLALALTGVIRKYLRDRGEVALSHDPVMERKPIVEFNNQMRVFDIEKFSTPTFVSTINYYDTMEDLRDHRALGFLVIFIEQGYLPTLLKLLKYPDIDWDDTNALRDASGSLCNVIAGQFKTEIVALSQKELEMSHFTYYDKQAAKGIEFPKGQTEKYEIDFEIDGHKRLCLEMTMGPLPLKY